ncbi:B-type cyclin CLB2 [Maudiozyma barnettii]|uniref:Similar to Saccharomyces cerevisiae YGR108W CLB1 B-type cyclin involved in cell cycle progression n=1 Tax=Maudiozyma barnettii TaxID=61262 RepID=A0A8H2VB92_9SACH|nr:uncharacterized protein KABA2_01S05764 [Kazachstania barnettii]CAB4252090.1 similar to Saccharomyces cerevisiae YGR108W CLB1 B-type cyclin involved in cell cycle progression [Kazachstania barnettii]
MSSSENVSTNNNNNSNNNSRVPRNAQRLALHNVTNTTLAQENVLQNLKPSIVSKKEILKESIDRSNFVSSSSIPNSQSSNTSTSTNIKSSELNIKQNPIKQPNLDDKENLDPYITTSKSLPSIEEENEIIDSQHVLSEQRSIVEKKDVSTTNSKDLQEKMNVGKKRPISTVVEQEEPKKFKVCDENGTEEYEWEDLDAEDANDPFMVSEYVNDIFDYLHHLEVVTLPRKEDLYQHRNIRQNRDILVNWLVKIHNKFGLLPETLYLAINIMDRFLCKELVQLDKLQLVGTSCLFIASKYEEVYSPSIKHFASETDGACTEEEIKEGENFILKTLDFGLNYPNPMNFLRRISKADDYDIQSRTLAKFLLEISLVDFRFIGILPSLCAAAAMFLSRKMLGKGKWDGNLIHYCGGYTKTQLAPVCHMVMDYLVSPIIHDEFHRKYQSRRFMKASIISVQWALKVRKNDYDIMTLHE